MLIQTYINSLFCGTVAFIHSMGEEILLESCFVNQQGCITTRLDKCLT